MMLLVTNVEFSIGSIGSLVTCPDELPNLHPIMLYIMQHQSDVSWYLYVASWDGHFTCYHLHLLKI